VAKDKPQKIALVHHWLTTPGGGERVLYELHLMYPDAPIYTSAYIPEKFPEFADAEVRTTFLDKIPYLKRKHQLFPLFLGLPFKTFNMDEFDLVISSCAAEAKYVRTGPNTLHICYCHTPVRYYWTDYEWRLKNMPFGGFNPLARIAFRLLVGPLRRIDYAAAQGVDAFIANSDHIKARIKQYYHRDSQVIYPPIVTQHLEKMPPGSKDFYLIVGRQVASKRLDIAVDAFNELGLTLKVAGSGEDIARQKGRAKSNIEFLGRVSDDERDQLFAGAKGFIFPPEEDFGMTPVESLAAGTPVIAYGKGGALEYVVEGVTGTLFAEQTSEALVEAVRRFEGMTFDTGVLRAAAKKFDVSVFREQIRAFIAAKWAEFEVKRDHSASN
jgi:glycosyltransferase involved in cell wall biosynthesis